MNTDSKINIFLTIDIEHSIGGAFCNSNLSPVNSEKRIFGRVGSRLLGLPFIFKHADEFGFKLSCFLEVMHHRYFGNDETKRICDYLLKSGQDIQLHLHPNYQTFSKSHPYTQIFSDKMSDYSLIEQTELLIEGKQLLNKSGVPNPIAFRAGGYGASIDTLKALTKAGFLIDSSFCRAFTSKKTSPSQYSNDAYKIENIFEFPVTSFIEQSGLRPYRYVPLDINGVSFREMKFILDNASNFGMANITIILHSFSLIKPYDVQYNRVRPRNEVIQRYFCLLRYLSENQDRFRVITFGELLFKKSILESIDTKRSMSPSTTYPKMPSHYSILRGFEQLRDKI